jgi:hypothetical protein
VSQVNEGASLVGYARKVSRHSCIVSRRIVNMNHQFFWLGLHRDGKKLWTKGIKFSSMNHDALNDSPGGNIFTTWKPWELHRTVSIVFVQAMVLFSTSGVFSSREVHIRPQTYL